MTGLVVLTLRMLAEAIEVSVSPANDKLKPFRVPQTPQSFLGTVAAIEGVYAQFNYEIHVVGPDGTEYPLADVVEFAEQTIAQDMLMHMAWEDEGGTILH